MDETKKKYLIESAKNPALRKDILNSIDEKEKHLEYLDFVFENIIKKYYKEDSSIILKLKSYFIKNKNNEGARSETLKKIIAFLYNKKDEISLLNFNTYLLELIFLLPPNDISENEIKIAENLIKNEKWSLRDIIYQSILPALIEIPNKDYLRRIIDAYLYKADKRYSGDEFYMEQTICSSVKTIADQLQVEGFKHFLKTQITAANKNNFNLGSIHALDGSGGSGYSFSWMFVVYFLVPYIEIIKDKFSENDVRNMLKSEFNIIKRLALHLIRKKYEKFKDCFWELPNNPFNNFELGYEIHAMFEENRELINKDDRAIEKLINWVESEDYSSLNNDNELNQEEKDKYKAFNKKRRIHPIYGDGTDANRNIKEKYMEYNDINDRKFSESSFHPLWSGIRDESSERKEDIKEITTGKDFSEMLNILSDKEKITSWDNEKKKQFISTHESFIMGNNKVSDYLDKIKTLDCFALCWVFDLFSNKNFKMEEENWNNILNFLEEIIKEERFWNKSGVESYYNFPNWLLMTIIRLTGSLSKIENLDFNIDIAKNILFLIEEKCRKSHKDDTKNDLVLHAANCSLAETYSSLIHLSLYISKKNVDENSESGIWDEDIKNFFTKRLKDDKNCKDLSFIIGQYINEVYYLDKAWLQKHVKFIFKKENEIWKDAFLGYLFYSRLIYNHNLTLLKDQYERALKLPDISENKLNIKNTALDHILVFYLSDRPESKKIIENILKNKNPKELTNIVRCLYKTFTIRKIINKNSEENEEKFKDDKQKEIFINLWDKLLAACLNGETDKYKEVLSEINRLSGCFKNFNKNIYEKLNKTIKFCSGSYTIVKILKYHIQNTPDMKNDIGELLLNLVKANNYFFTNKKDIKYILMNIHSNLKNEVINEIFKKTGERINM